MDTGYLFFVCNQIMRFPHTVYHLLVKEYQSVPNHEINKNVFQIKRKYFKI